MSAAMLGRSLSQWPGRPPVPFREPPERYDIGNGIALWRLPVGYVRIRERHREMPDRLADPPDGLRFPLMMADRALTGWLNCTAWLIRHPEANILVDTGESDGFGTPAYFEGVPALKRHLYPRILDAATPSGGNLASALHDAGASGDAVELCILTHLHSDHVGNLHQLGARTRFLLAREETLSASGTGRLPEKLPRDERVAFTSPRLSVPGLGNVEPITARGDVFVVSTPGHTIGHQSVVIDLGDAQIVLAGDAAFSDEQVRDGRVPGIVEDGGAVRRSYSKLLALQSLKPTVTLFTHDPLNKRKLATFRAPRAGLGLSIESEEESSARPARAQ